jgi:hypothetical protein
MGIFGQLKDQSSELTEDSDKRDQIIQSIAHEHGMTIDEAKTHYTRQLN